MVGLVIYIASFVIVIAIVATITTFFNSNVRDLKGSESVSAEYNKFNAYMLEYTKNGYDILKCSQGTSAEDQFITFTKDGKMDTFTKLGNSLYFNKIRLCEKVDEFKIEKTTAENGKDLVKTYLKIDGTAYTTDYIMENKNSDLWKYSGVNSTGSLNGGHVHLAGETNEVFTSGSCSITPTQFYCDFRCGNHAASKTGEVNFTVQGYTNENWETLFIKSATRPVRTATYSVFSGRQEFTTTKTYTNFRVLFNSSDNERYVYVELKIK